MQSVSVYMWIDAEKIAPGVVCLPLAQPHPTQQHQNVSVKCLGQDSVKKRVCTGVQRIKEHKQHLWRKCKSVLILRNRKKIYIKPTVDSRF